MNRIESMKYVLTISFLIISIILMGMTIFKSNREIKIKYRCYNTERVKKH